jgi:chondroitin synthase
MSRRNGSTFVSNDYSEVERELYELASIDYRKSVTVVIPFYRGRIFLERTLSSLTNQSYPSRLYEIVIVQQDDGGETIDDLIDDIGRLVDVKFIQIPHVGFTPGRCRNTGIRNASGEIIVSIDFDMICPREYVEAHLRWHHATDRAASFGLRRYVEVDDISPRDVVTNWRKIEQRPSVESVSNSIRGSRLDKRIAETEYIKTHPHPYNCFHGCNLSYPRDAALEVGGWDEEFDGRYGYQDIEFGYRLWRRGLFIVFARDGLALHQENQTSTYEHRARGRDKNRILLYEKVPGIQRFRESIDGGSGKS